MSLALAKGTRRYGISLEKPLFEGRTERGWLERDESALLAASSTDIENQSQYGSRLVALQQGVLYGILQSDGPTRQRLGFDRSKAKRLPLLLSTRSGGEVVGEF